MIKPVTIVAGFLGAGKTTLALRLISQGMLRDAVLIVNDFGEVSFDSAQVASTGVAYRALENGCICCSAKDDLVKILHEIPELFPSKTEVWIETSGISAPGDLISLFQGSSFLSAHFQVSSVLTVVDGRCAIKWLSSQDSVVEQIAFASTILINDFGSPDEIENSVVDWIRTINPVAPISIRSLNNDAIKSFQSFFDYAYQAPKPEILEKIRAPQNELNHGFCTHTIRWTGCLNERAFAVLIDDWIEKYGSGLLRLKGVARLDSKDELMVIQGVRRQMMFDYDSSSEWPDEGFLVLIGTKITEESVAGLSHNINSLSSQVGLLGEEETCQRL